MSIFQGITLPASFLQTEIDKHSSRMAATATMEMPTAAMPCPKGQCMTINNLLMSLINKPIPDKSHNTLA